MMLCFVKRSGGKVPLARIGEDRYNDFSRVFGAAGKFCRRIKRRARRDSRKDPFPPCEFFCGRKRVFVLDRKSVV